MFIPIFKTEIEFNSFMITFLFEKTTKVIAITKIILI